MPDEHLYAPWRMTYIKSLEKRDGQGCFLCEDAACTADAECRQRHVLWTSARCVVVINRYPYTNGHLLVAPRRHVAEIEDLTDAEAADMHMQTVTCVKLLRKAMSPQAFNIGLNLGHAAGAGLPGHLHQHVVPRWAGDTNFMSVVAKVRIVPQALEQLWDELRKTYAGL
ncbi:MAG: HIT domain-containing protein [Phycisphaerae bacterium]